MSIDNNLSEERNKINEMQNLQRELDSEKTSSGIELNDTMKAEWKSKIKSLRIELQDKIEDTNSKMETTHGFTVSDEARKTVKN